MKIKFFLNDPKGKTWNHFSEMIPRLGEKYDIDIEVISNPRATYATEEYLISGLPKAPAIMVNEQVVIEGRDISEQELEKVIRQRLEETEGKAWAW